MISKRYGIRHIKARDMFVPFRELTLFGIVIQYREIGHAGDLLMPEIVECITRERALYNIQEHIKKVNTSKEKKWEDEIVYKEEWWVRWLLS